MARCGDGIVRGDRNEGQEGYEACDDGNLLDEDACTNACAARCGDGIRALWEACDDGNQVNTDACTDGCALPAARRLVFEGEEAATTATGSTKTAARARAAPTSAATPF